MKLVYIVFAWLTLYAIELESVVCIVRPLNNVFKKKKTRDFSIANEIWNSILSMENATVCFETYFSLARLFTGTEI